MIWGYLATYMIIMAALSIYLTAIDGWISFLFTEEQKPKGTYARFLGFGCGAYMSYNFFSLFNSDKWCREKLDLKGKIFDKHHYILVLAAYCLVSSILIAIFVSEKYTVNPKVSKFKDVVKAFKSI